MSQGRRANTSGRFAEDAVVGALKARGCELKRQVVLGTNLYGSDLRVDVLISNLVPYPHGLVVESKWQDQEGSADEKYPYLVENIRTCFPVPAIVVLHGNGYRDGACRWLRSQVDGQKLVAVFNFEEFMSWLLRIKDDQITSSRLFV